jgi:hypothetical protein
VGGNWHGFGASNADFGCSDFQNTIIGEATKVAVEQMSSQVIADKDKLQNRTISVSGLVAAVEQRANHSERRLKGGREGG